MAVWLERCKRMTLMSTLRLKKAVDEPEVLTIPRAGSFETSIVVNECDSNDRR